MKKKIIFPVIAILLLVGATIIVSTQVHAQTTRNPFSGLVTAIAQKFGLDQTQVQSVVNTYMGQQKQNFAQTMQQREESRLNTLVSQGKITDFQKQAILDEQAKLKTEYPSNSFKNLTADQRKQQFQNEQNEIKTWASAEGIDPSYVRPFFGIGLKDRERGRWFMNKPTPTPSG